MRASDLILAAAVMLGAYESFKALEAKSDERVAGLLQFWVVIAVLQMVEPIFDTTFSWIPLYDTVKFLTYIGLASKEFRSQATKSILWPIVTPVYRSMMRHLTQLREWACTAIVRRMTWGFKATTSALISYVSDEAVEESMEAVAGLAARLKHENTNRLRISMSDLFFNDDSAVVGSGDKKALAQGGPNAPVGSSPLPVIVECEEEKTREGSNVLSVLSENSKKDTVLEKDHCRRKKSNVTVKRGRYKTRSRRRIRMSAPPVPPKGLGREFR